MKSDLRLRSVTRSIMALFSTKTTTNPHNRYPDAYFKTIWVSSKMFAGIDWVAKFERISKVRAANRLLERGFRSWIAEKIKAEMAIRKLEREPHLTRFVLELRKLAKERGMDISKFI